MERFLQHHREVLLKDKGSDKLQLYCTCQCLPSAETLVMLLNYGLKYLDEHLMDQARPRIDKAD